MVQHYVQTTSDRDISGQAIPLSTTHYNKVIPNDITMPNSVAVTVWNTGVVKEIISPDIFNAKYTAVDMTSDSDQLPTPPPSQMLLQSPNGTPFSLAVTNAGAIKADPVS